MLTDEFKGLTSRLSLILFPFSQLPLTMSSFERLNDYPVNVPGRLSLAQGDENYVLRSVVAVSETKIGPSGISTGTLTGFTGMLSDRANGIITGRTGLIVSQGELTKDWFEPQYYLYDPFGASLPVRILNKMDILPINQFHIFLLISLLNFLVEL